MQAKIKAIQAGLENFSRSNRRLAIDEPANDFERAVNDHYELQSLIKLMKESIKTLETEEKQRRQGIAESLNMYFGENLREGTNNYLLSNMRKLKYKNKITRSIDPALISVARDAFSKVEKPTVTFDSLLRTKYEVVAAQRKKLTPAEEHAFSRCMTSKPALCELEVD